MWTLSRKWPRAKAGAIGQASVPWLTERSDQTVIGWRADCIGRPNLTYEMLPPKVEKMGDTWKKGHISFEAYWWLGEWDRQGWDLDKIIETLLSWHVSTFNAKSLPIPFKWKDKIDDWVAKMGYHFVIDEVETQTAVKHGEPLALKIVVDNVGVAPIYNKLALNIKLKNSQGEKVIETGVDIREWLPGKHTEALKIALPKDMKIGTYELQIGIGGNEEPSVYFASNAKQDGAYCVLTEVEIIP